MRTTLTVSLCLASLLWATGASAQEVGPRMGVIPGTDMTRDEFRARAQAQCAAIALNAVTYYLAKDSYAPDIYTLQASPAWNLRIANMFTGRPVQGIYFEPSADAMTNDPAIGLSGMDLTPDLPPPPPQQQGGGQIGPQKDEKPQLNLNANFGTMRVDPAAIRDYDAGDVYYYTKGDLLQLIIYAPDGTYYEWVDDMPNANFRTSLQLRSSQPDENLYAAQVLYYVESLAGQHYNLVQYMAGRETVPGAAVGDLPGSKKIELAGRVGITVVNPVTKQPETAAKSCSPGVILEGSPLKICTAKGESLSITEMTMAREDVGHAPPKPKVKAKPKPKPGSRPPGGSTPGAPGGGRRG
jgi:hypothetical protein